MKRIFEVAILTVLFLLICFVYKGQSRISLNDGQGWDGTYYYSISEQILQHANPIVGEAPYINRPGTPFLFAVYSRITGADLLNSALVVNLAGIFLTVLFLLFWLSLFIKESWLKIGLCSLLMMGWYLPLRISFYDVMATDAWGAAWFMAGVLLLPAIRRMYERKNNKALLGYVLLFSLIVAFGSLFRESNTILFPALFFVANPLKGFKGLSVKVFTFSALRKSFGNIGKLYNNPQILLLFIPLIFIVLIKIVLSKFILIEPSDYSYIKTIFKWFYLKSLPEFLLGIFNACGPLVLLLPFYIKEVRVLFWERQELLFLCLTAFIFGLIGGSDTERIFFMSAFPVLLIWMGYAIKDIFESTHRWWFYVLCALQTIAFRFFWSVPDFPSNVQRIPVPFFGLLGNHFQYLFLYSHCGQYILNSILFAEYFALLMVTWYILSRKSYKTVS